MGRAESLLLFNLKNLNLLKSDVNDSQSEYITPQEDYKFYFIRSSPKIFNSNFQYLCKWIITTYPIQHTLLELFFHENDIYYLIDNITQYIEYNFETFPIVINIIFIFVEIQKYIIIFSLKFIIINQI